jgi:hypothetical protein
LQKTRQLGLLESVSLQQSGLLLTREEDVLRDKLVVGDIDKQIVFKKALNLGERLNASQRLAGGGRERHVCHHNTSLVVVRDYIGSKLSNLANTKGLVSEELDPDRTTVGARVGVGCCRGRREFADHVVAGTRRELEFGAIDGTIGVAVLVAEALERDLDFFFSKLVFSVRDHLMDGPPCPPKPNNLL